MRTSSLRTPDPNGSGRDEAPSLPIGGRAVWILDPAGRSRAKPTCRHFPPQAQRITGGTVRAGKRGATAAIEGRSTPRPSICPCRGFAGLKKALRRSFSRQAMPPMCESPMPTTGPMRAARKRRARRFPSRVVLRDVENAACVNRRYAKGRATGRGGRVCPHPPIGPSCARRAIYTQAVFHTHGACPPL